MSKKEIDFSEIYDALEALGNSINSIEEECTSEDLSGVTLDEKDISDISDKIAEALSSDGTDLVEDFDCSCSGKEIELDSIDFDEGRIYEIVEEILTEKFGIKVNNNSKTKKKK